MSKRTKKEIAESEKRMEAHVKAAGKSARHLIASLGDLAIVAANSRHLPEKEAQETLCKALDKSFEAFCEALVDGWRMMLVQEVENGILDIGIFAKDLFGKEVAE